MPNKTRLYNHFSHDYNREDKSNNKKNSIRLDSINVSIINELVSNTNAKSPEIAKKLKIPLSTVQRRKASLEKSILKKDMRLILQNLDGELLTS